jgi:NADH-quinone oxidoreductase subunit J
MASTFYISGIIAVIATVLAISRTNGVHALLYLIVSLLAVALVFLTLGAPFVAALEVIIYAGAIMVLFVFVAILFNLGEEAAWQERKWQKGRMWIVPAILAAILLAEVVRVVISVGRAAPAQTASVGPHEVGVALYGPYLLGVELASLLLLSALIGAYHIGRRTAESEGKS